MKKTSGTKKALNVTVDSGLLQSVRESDINVSSVLEKALREEMARRWQVENADAFEENRKRVEANGLWCDNLRVW